MNPPPPGPALLPDATTAVLSPFSRVASPSLISKRHKMQKFLGRGGCGEVFAASDRAPGRRLAIQAIPTGEDSARGAEQRLRALRMAAKTGALAWGEINMSVHPVRRAERLPR